MKTIKMSLAAWILILFLFQVCCADELSFGDYAYTLLPDGSAELTKYTGNDPEIQIPSELEGTQVTSIGDSAFAYNETLKSVLIPEGIVSVGNHAFGECPAVETISLPDSLVWIGDSAFQGCVLLREVILPSAIVRIGWNPFDRCDSLSRIELSDVNPYYMVQDGALFDRKAKELICYPGGLEGSAYSIPDWVISVGMAAFSENSRLRELTLPDSVTEITGNPFCGCITLTNISISSDNLIYEMIDGALYNKQSRELIAYLWGTVNTAYSVPAGTTSIAQEAFYKHKELAMITLPKTVVSIGMAAFAESGLVSIKLPAGIKMLAQNTFSGCENLTEVSLPSGLTTIGSAVFYQCPRLRHITLPGTLRSIGDAAFYLCQSLINVAIPDGVLSIGNHVFAGCFHLRSVSFPKSVLSIGQDVFLKAEKITLTVDRESYAEEWAKENNIDFHYRNTRPVPSDAV